jgi:hypothetical protein
MAPWPNGVGVRCDVGRYGVRLLLGGTDHTVRDRNGKWWRFEMHPYCGPIVLRADGEPAAQQPGSHSPFWVAFNRWHQKA